MKGNYPLFGILVVGETGTGKTTLINNLMREDIVNEDDSFESQTVKIQKHTMVVEGVPVALYDTPGLSDSRCDLDAEYLKEMECILKAGEIQLVIYCLKLTETRMRQSLIHTFLEFSKIGVKWEHTVVVLTFADVVPVPSKEKQMEGFVMAHFFDDRVAKMRAHIIKVLVENVGVTQKCADHILCKPSTSDPNEMLPNGKQWFVPLWLDILEVL